MSLHDAGALDPAGRPDLDRLVSVARLLAARAPGWPGMTRPAYRRWISWPSPTTSRRGSSPGHRVAPSSCTTTAARPAQWSWQPEHYRETRVVSQPSGPWALETSTIGVGETTCFAAHDVHDIVNVAEAPAISVHVYAPRLTTMTYYRMTQGVLEAGSTVHYRFGEAVA